jgi:hypothetical protein
MNEEYRLQVRCAAVCVCEVCVGGGGAELCHVLGARLLRSMVVGEMLASRCARIRSAGCSV